MLDMPPSSHHSWRTHAAFAVRLAMSRGPNHRTFPVIPLVAITTYFECTCLLVQDVQESWLAVKSKDSGPTISSAIFDCEVHNTHIHTHTYIYIYPVVYIYIYSKEV